MSVLEDVSEALSALVERAAPSVVGVGPHGSGVIVGPDQVLTNAHNLRDGADVVFADGRAAQAAISGADLDGDLAVLTVSTGTSPALDWSVTEASVGHLVVGLSRPGGRVLRAGTGIVAGLGLAFRGPGGRAVEGALEHTAPLPPGSSGGPLLDSHGRLIGINTHRPREGAYLALPASEALRERVRALAEGKVPPQRRLGVALAPPEVARRLRLAVGLPEHEGLLVHEVDPAGPAAQAGAKKGDLIVSLRGQSISSVAGLAEVLRDAALDEPLELVVLRGADEVRLVVQLQAQPGPAGPQEVA